ncbi:MAG TPA: hypothetical protein VMV44_05370 [Rectinemataceae bacterium]|nr:hypothetical protein [Rectinemataceae bacterium]
MEEKTKLRVTVAVTITLGLAYFFLFATPLPKPLSLMPRWVSSVQPSQTFDAAAHAATGELLSFELSDRYGYFDRNAGVVFSATRGYGESISDSGFSAWDMKPSQLTFRDPKGTILFTTTMQGYPFMNGDRRFVISSNQAEITELGPTGSPLWNRDFPSMVTAFASNKNIAVLGTLDGHLFAIDSKGRELLSFAPGGSRIACVYGLAISPDGKTIAATTGLDSQRVIVLEKREEAYRVTWHRWTESDFRRPVAMSFTPDGRELVFETSNGFGIYDVASRKEYVLAARDPLVTDASVPARDIILIQDNGSRRNIVAASYGGKRYFAFPFVADDSTLRSEGDSLFVGLRNGDASEILRLDFVEE